MLQTNKYHTLANTSGSSGTNALHVGLIGV